MKSIVTALATLMALAVLAPLTPADAADLKAARKKISMCRTCHGLDGIGTNPTVPNLAGESAVYIMSQLKAFRSGQREHEVMSIIAKDLTDEDIALVASWYSALKIQVTLPQQ